MASVMESSGDPKPATIELKYHERKEMKRLRNAGLEYVSRSGKLVPAKTQQDVLCNCPQRCADKVPKDVRENLFAQFYKLGDHELQNEFLQAHIETLAIKKRRYRGKNSQAEPQGQGPASRSPRRVTCRYLIPLVTKDALITPVRLAPTMKCIEVCQKAFMHMFAITEKRVRLQREKLISRVKSQDNDSEPSSLSRDFVTEEQMCEVRSSTVFPIDFEVFRTELDRDVAIVNNFFHNQLWKPEYITQ